MTKLDIVNELYERLGFSKRECSTILEEFLRIVKDALISGESVKISGFGSFIVKEKAERRGRNPKTGKEMLISRRKVLTFKLSQVLREEMNKK